MIPSDLPTQAWQALKAECCVHPATAQRIVMVEEPAFRRAMDKITKSLDSQLDDLGLQLELATVRGIENGSVKWRDGLREAYSTVMGIRGQIGGWMAVAADSSQISA